MIQLPKQAQILVVNLSKMYDWQKVEAYDMGSKKL